MVFINDEANTLIPSAKGGEVLYDFELMFGGGHIRGERVSGEEAERVRGALDALPGGIKYAMGDGNHSLAAAKLCWERLKPTLSEAERETNPARYALTEIVNIHDEAVEFKPIHRLVTGEAAGRVAEAFAEKLPHGAANGVGIVTARGRAGIWVRRWPWESLWPLRTGLWASCSPSAAARSTMFTATESASLLPGKSPAPPSCCPALTKANSSAT